MRSHNQHMLPRHLPHEALFWFELSLFAYDHSAVLALQLFQPVHVQSLQAVILGLSLIR